MKNGKSTLRLHSPFVFEFACEVLRDKKQYYAFSAIEARRKQLAKDSRPIEVIDFGAGSRKEQRPLRKVKEIARTSSVPAKYGRMLFRMAIHYKPRTILEMGSCVGLGTLYLASPGSHERLATLEGDPTLAEIARQSIASYPLANLKARLFEGEFSETLPQALAHLGQVDLAYIDGNHRKEPTLCYFEQVLPYCDDNSILVFDDIYWSEEMTEAWEAIKAHPKVVITIDLYRMGLVFFRREHKEKEHFMLWF